MTTGRQPTGALERGRLARVFLQPATARLGIAQMGIALRERFHQNHYTARQGQSKGNSGILSRAGCGWGVPDTVFNREVPCRPCHEKTWTCGG